MSLSSLVFFALGSAFYLLFSGEACLLLLCNHLFLNSLALRVVEALGSSVDARTVRPVLVVCSEEAVPPPERRGIVIHKSHMMKVVMLGSRPKWYNVLK